MPRTSASLSRLRYLGAKAIRRGRRTILLTPNPGPRFGNFLYYWLQAFQRQAQGESYRVQVHSHLTEWLCELPGIRQDLSELTENIRFFDRREWPPDSQFQVYGHDFDLSTLRRFVAAYLLPVPSLNLGPTDPNRVVINVRRGDFYSIDKFRRLYAFNIPPYVATALRKLLVREPIGSVHVVSDDILWCRKELESVIREFTDRVSYVRETARSQEHFATLANAHRIVGANSTFSYWASYIATIKYGPDAHVVMPRFRTHAISGGGAHQLLPCWDTVESIPGGWHVPTIKSSTRQEYR